MTDQERGKYSAYSGQSELVAAMARIKDGKEQKTNAGKIVKDELKQKPDENLLLVINVQRGK